MRTVQDDFFGDPRMGLLMAAVQGQRNTEDSARKSAATRDGKRRRAERGDSTGPLPFGYRLEPRPDGDGRVRVPDAEEVPFVLRAFAMLDEGRGIGEITRWLNAQGARTKRGNAFGRGRVRDMLRNPWYGGRMRAYGEVVDGNHEPLMEWDEFQRISAKLDRDDPAAKKRRDGGRPSTVALLSGVLFCAHCGHGIWHRTGRRRRYVCGNRRHATGVCTEAAPFDAELTEQAVLDHFDSLFLDFDGWLKGVTEHRASQRAGIEAGLADLRRRADDLGTDEALVRTDYMRQLREGNETASHVAASETERIAAERQRLADELRTAEAGLVDWDRRNAEDEMLDFWTELSNAVRGGVVNAESVAEANTALRERFAAIYVTSPREGSPRLDFILKERAQGAPLVSSRLWADDPADLPDDGMLVSFIQEDLDDERVRVRARNTGGLTLV